MWYCYLQEAEIDYSTNNELRKLQFFGAGPKMAIPAHVKGKTNYFFLQLKYGCTQTLASNGKSSSIERQV